MPNLHTASKLAQLDALGSSTNSFAIEGQNDLLKRICGEFIKRVHQNIESAGHGGKPLKATGKIADIELIEEPNGISIAVNPHLIYQDAGVNGSKVKLYDTPFSYSNKMPPVDQIKEWVNLKGIQTENAERFYDEKVDIAEGAAFAIAKKIQLYGQAPKDIYSKEIPELIADLAESFADYSVREILKNL